MFTVNLTIIAQIKPKFTVNLTIIALIDKQSMQ